MIRLECISLASGQTIPIPEANIICLGNFDGVHLGHRALLRRAKQLQATDPKFHSASCAVFCFREHPSALLGRSTAQLCTLEQKLEAFAAEGMNCVIFADFFEIRDLSPDEFAQTVLVELCHCQAAVCGFNYRYGKGGLGTPDQLQSTLPARVEILEEITAFGDTVSSSRIRALLSQGEVQTAALLLNRPYSFTSSVLHGKQLGRRLGTPTINQTIPKGLQIPLRGVYITECKIGNKSYRGVSNIGVHPTVDADAPVNCETYLLDFSGDLYGQTVTVSLLAFLRPEQRFESLDALRTQILADVDRARNF